MERKISSIIISLLLLSSIIVFVNNELNVEATGGGEGNNNYLNYTFLWEAIHNFSNIVHRKDFWPNDIRMGRAFGTEGDRWAANYTRDKMIDDFNMTDVHRVEIESIPWKPDEWNDFWKYNYKVEPLDFNLEIYGDGYPFDNIVPKNETFAAPSGVLNYIYEIGNFMEMDYNNSFTNISVISRDINTWPTPLFDNDHYNVSLFPINNNFSFIGNASYLTINDDVPEFQELNVFF